MKSAILVLLVCACATAPQVVAVEQSVGPPRVPQALDLAVRAMDQESVALLPAALQQAKQGLMALGHPVIGDGAPLRVEFDVGPISRTSVGACARVSGRIIRDGQRFSAVEFRSDGCRNTAVSGGWFPTGHGGSDALGALAVLAVGGLVAGLDRPEFGAALVHSELGPLLPRISAAAQR